MWRLWSRPSSDCQQVPPNAKVIFFCSAATLLYDPIDMEFYPAAESLIVSLEAGARRWPICHGRPNAGLGMWPKEQIPSLLQNGTHLRLDSSSWLVTLKANIEEFISSSWPRLQVFFEALCDMNCKFYFQCPFVIIIVFISWYKRRLVFSVICRAWARLSHSTQLMMTIASNSTNNNLSDRPTYKLT